VIDRLRDAGSAAVSVSGDFGAVDDDIEVYTTRCDTVFGATYIALAPEHPLVARVTTEEYRQEVEEYLARTSRQDLVSRKTARDKTGVFTGAYARNPATHRPIPIWVADYVLMEYGTGAIMAVPGHDERDMEFARKYSLHVVRVVAGPGETDATPLELAWTDEEASRLVNSAEFNGLSVSEGKTRILEWLVKQGFAKKEVNYRLHDWCISRQRYWGPPIPVIHCDECGAQPVPEKDLPVLLPDIPDFRPDDSGISPLARHEQWYRVECPECKGPARRETDVSDTFLDSAWYFIRYPSARRKDVPFDRDLTERWLPVSSYIGGNEHAVLHLLYSRFVTMALHDGGHFSFEEPYRKFRAHGLIIREGAKMSKSRGNVVNPDKYIEDWGADSFRTYLMFLGPFEEGGDFRDRSISGVRRFLNQLWLSVEGALGSDASPTASDDVLRKLHRTIRKVSDDIPRLSYNTAIAAMMEYLNVVRAHERSPHRDELLALVRMVAPFAPHIAEELWERLGSAVSVFDSGWPQHDAELAAEPMVELAVQVNGKLRGTIRAARDVSQDEALAAALREASIAKFVQAEPRKIVFVEGRLLNIVV
jgi:leucyl-tRNA synthetase